MKYSFFSSELFCPPSALMMAVSASAASSAPLASWVKYVPGREAGRRTTRRRALQSAGRASNQTRAGREKPRNEHGENRVFHALVKGDRSRLRFLSAPTCFRVVFPFLLCSPRRSPRPGHGCNQPLIPLQLFHAPQTNRSEQAILSCSHTHTHTGQRPHLCVWL